MTNGGAQLPTLRVSTPVYELDGNPFGFLIINVDMRAVFDQVRLTARPGESVYIVNQRGDFRSATLGQDLRSRRRRKARTRALVRVRGEGELRHDEQEHRGGDDRPRR